MKSSSLELSIYLTLRSNSVKLHFMVCDVTQLWTYDVIRPLNTYTLECLFLFSTGTKKVHIAPETPKLYCSQLQSGTFLMTHSVLAMMQQLTHLIYFGIVSMVVTQLKSHSHLRMVSCIKHKCKCLTIGAGLLVTWWLLTTDIFCLVSCLQPRLELNTAHVLMLVCTGAD